MTRSVTDGLGFVPEDVDPARLRGDLSAGEAVWGVVGTSGRGDARVSNAVVGNGDRMVMRVAPVGQGVGFHPAAPGVAVYARARLSMTMHDVVRGVSSELVFDSWGDDASAASRHVEWVVPERDALAERFHGAYGVDGVFVLSVREEGDLFVDQGMTLPLIVAGVQARTSTESHVQFVAVNLKEVLGEVVVSPRRNVSFLEGADFLTSGVVGAEGRSWEDIFDSDTVYPLYRRTSGSGFVEPSADQKEAILRVAAMAWLSSQTPIAPADVPVAPVLGIGASQRPTSQVGAGGGRHAAPAEPQPSQLFGLDAVPAATNTHETLCDMVDRHSRTRVRLANPPRVIVVPPGGGSATLDLVPFANVLSGVRSPAAYAPGEVGFQVGFGGLDARDPQVDGYRFSSSSSSSASSPSSSSTAWMGWSLFQSESSSMTMTWESLSSNSSTSTTSLTTTSSEGVSPNLASSSSTERAGKIVLQPVINMATNGSIDGDPDTSETVVWCDAVVRYAFEQAGGPAKIDLSPGNRVSAVAAGEDYSAGQAVSPGTVLRVLFRQRRVLRQVRLYAKSGASRFSVKVYRYLAGSDIPLETANIGMRDVFAPYIVRVSPAAEADGVTIVGSYGSAALSVVECYDEPVVRRPRLVKGVSVLCDLSAFGGGGDTRWSAVYCCNNGLDTFVGYFVHPASSKTEHRFMIDPPIQADGLLMYTSLVENDYLYVYEVRALEA